MKRTGRNAVRGSEGRRFRALAAFCQGFAEGIGSPMFELKRYAWNRGYRCDVTKVDKKIERPLIRAGASHRSRTPSVPTRRQPGEC